MIALLLILGGLALAGAVATFVSAARDGYRRRPVCPTVVRRT